MRSRTFTIILSLAAQRSCSPVKKGPCLFLSFASCSFALILSTRLVPRPLVAFSSSSVYLFSYFFYEKQMGCLCLQKASSSHMQKPMLFPQNEHSTFSILLIPAHSALCAENTSFVSVLSLLVDSTD